MNKRFRGLVAAALVCCTILPAGLSGAVKTEAASKSTGVGLAAHAMTAYNQGWKYVYGGSTPGRVDCSGLIYTYNGVGGSRSSMYYSASVKGSISTLPRIHGLGLYQPGHVGVYVGGGMAVDARDSRSNMKYQSVSGKSWTSWFKVVGVSYPDTGWVKFNGKSFYYKNGQYVVNTTLSIKGKKYSFNSSGALISSPPPSSDYLDVSYSSSGASVSTGSSNSNKTSNKGSSASTYRTLQIGSSGSDVLKLQNRLKALNWFNDDTTNYYGDYTAKCIKAFQKAAGLSETGVANAATQKKLYASNAPKYVETIYKKGDTGDKVKGIQTQLKKLGYIRDNVTDKYGDATAAAVKLFQKQAKLEVNGEVNEKTYKALFAKDAPKNPEAGTLKSGYKGDDVKEMQARLFELRYTTEKPSGAFDDATVNTVKAYQKASKLKETGSLTKAQLQALYSEEAVKSPEYDNLQLGYEGDDILALQEKLSELDFYTSDITGSFDEDTESAVKAFQKDNDLEETGIAAPALIELMDETIEAQNNVVPMVINSIAPARSAQGGATVAALGLASPSEPSASDNTSDTIWTLLVVFVMMGMASGVYLMKKHPYFIHKLLRKSKIKRNVRAAAVKTKEK